MKRVSHFFLLFFLVHPQNRIKNYVMCHYFKSGNEDSLTTEYESIVNRLPIRNLGPGGGPGNGRISAIAVFEKSPRIFFIGSASGGVFKTVDAGISFSTFFEKEFSSSIGAIAVSKSNPDVVWVGTGESWQRNDAGWGDGIYKTGDGGKSWQKMGLEKSFSICKIIIDPNDEKIVYAGVTGNAWGYGNDRGVYRTIDGGRTWRRILYIDDKTGVADMVMDPQNSNTIIVAMWEKVREPYRFIGGGSGSGLFRTTDGGNNWSKLTSGLPKGLVGRISVDYYLKNSQCLVAAVEADSTENGIYKSFDGGSSWVRMPALNIDLQGKLTKAFDQFYFGRPYYSQLIRFNPLDSNIIFHGGPMHFSMDGGKTFSGMTADNHVFWIDPKNPDHMIWGDDSGVNQTWTGKQQPTEDRWKQSESPANIPPIGQVYRIGFDMHKPYWVMGGLQDEPSFMIPTQTGYGGVSRFDVIELLGADGGLAMGDPKDPTTAYSSGAGFELFRNNVQKGNWKFIGPSRGRFNNCVDDLGHRANYTAAWTLSNWDHKTLYFGANVLYKSFDQGNSWKIISPDLTNSKKEWLARNITLAGQYDENGGEVYGTIVSISESPLKKNILWVGTDDGNVQLTKNGGLTWENSIHNFKDLPQFSWVSSIYASSFSAGRAYITFDGHRNNDFKTHVYITEDFGKTWKNINGNLPENESCYVIKEGLKNPDLLFLGTEHGLYISLNRGQNWIKYASDDFPTIAIYDLKIHPRDLDLIIGTHGRSVYLLPIRALEELTVEKLNEKIFFISPGNIYQINTYRTPIYFFKVKGGFSKNTQPGTLFCYYLRKAAIGTAKITIKDSKNNVVLSISGTTQIGLNIIRWYHFDANRRFKSPNTLAIGRYNAILTIDTTQYIRTFFVEAPS